MNSKTSLLAIALVLMAACDDSGLEIRASYNDSLELSLSNVKFRTLNGSRAVYGDLRIVATKPYSLDLKCLAISADGIGSGPLYMDSIASVLPQVDITVDQPVVKSVYWVLDSSTYDRRHDDIQFVEESVRKVALDQCN